MTQKFELCPLDDGQQIAGSGYASDSHQTAGPRNLGHRRGQRKDTVGAILEEGVSRHNKRDLCPIQLYRVVPFSFGIGKNVRRVRGPQHGQRPGCLLTVECERPDQNERERAGTCGMHDPIPQPARTTGARRLLIAATSDHPIHPVSSSRARCAHLCQFHRQK